MKRTVAENIEVGRRAKQHIASWRNRALEEQVKHPDLQMYAHDVQVTTRLEEMPDATLGWLLELATRENLEKLGYEGLGVRSNSGETSTTIFTAALHLTAQKFGREVVNLSSKESWAFRGVLNRTDVRQFFAAKVDEIIAALLTLEEKQ